MKICISAILLQAALDALKKNQKFDACVSDIIEIEVVEKTDVHNKSDRVIFSAQSIYAECNNHILKP